MGWKNPVNRCILGDMTAAPKLPVSPKQPVLIVVHQEQSTPGRIGDELQALGYSLDIRRPCIGHELPRDMSGHAGVVVFGGPMSANDDHLPFIRRELDWIPMAAASGKPYLGVCLGAQMLARAAGARVAPHADGWHEIGYYPLQVSAAGRALFPEKLHVYQWHGEGFDLPKAAEHLAGTKWFPNQAFAMGGNAFGIQFHPEVTGAMMRVWTTRAAHRLVMPGAQCRQTQYAGHARHDGGIAAWLRGFLPRWLNGTALKPAQKPAQKAAQQLAPAPLADAAD